MSNEKERETHVYTAKLAEQAERYEGMRECVCVCVCNVNLFYVMSLMRLD
ncbi:putative 14-3-3 domain superfamily protein [Helianthus annuus]|nr:putative 14-3-3 domain superfamily protein [Helianthus annuus]